MPALNCYNLPRHNVKFERVNITALLPADYCQRGLRFTSSGGRSEFFWKRDIELGCKALRLKSKQADTIENVHLGKMYVKPKGSIKDLFLSNHLGSSDASNALKHVEVVQPIRRHTSYMPSYLIYKDDIARPRQSPIGGVQPKRK